jgi:hypothetical protein
MKKKMLRVRPIAFIRVDNHLVPLPRFQRAFDEQYAINEEYALIKSEDRNMTRHRGYFAQIKEAFNNLTEEYANGYPSVDHLRADALIMAGYYTEARYVMDSRDEAKHLGVMLRRLSPLAVIRIKGNVVLHFEAKSQSVSSMGREEFETSCRKVLHIVASMARTTPAELKKNAGRAA